jgi:hypothetical protein
MAFDCGIGDGLTFASLEEIQALVSAFEAVCRYFRIVSSRDPMAKIIALKVVEAARAGERNPERLRDLVLLSLRRSVAS